MKLITVDGPDFSGKTTLIKKIASNIKGDIRIIKSPFSTDTTIKEYSDINARVVSNEELGVELIKDILNKDKSVENQFVMMTICHFQVKKYIEKNKDVDCTIIQDRNFLSTLIYQRELIKKYELTDLVLHYSIPEGIKRDDMFFILLLPPFATVIDRKKEVSNNKDTDELSFFEESFEKHYKNYVKLIHDRPESNALFKILGKYYKIHVARNDLNDLSLIFS